MASRSEVSEKPSQSKDAEKNEQTKYEADESEQPHKHHTSFMDTIIHLFKGNVGPGLFAMGDAFKNGGIVASPFLILTIAIIAVHCQHLLINCARKIRDLTGQKSLPDYAETVEKCFEIGPPKLRRFAGRMKTTVNIFICVTQLGFCCIYFVFIATNFKQILDHYGWVLDVHIIMGLIFIPVLLPSLITNLKYLAPVSMVANFFMISGLAITMYYAFEGGVPSPSEREYFTSGPQMALFFGTAIFAFEGIALVLPLKSAMRNPHQFARPCGVLNIGMTAVTFLFAFAGFMGYLKWGDAVEGSLTLNLDINLWPAQYVKVGVSLGVLLGYALQFFIAVEIMWPTFREITKCQQTVLGELVFRFALCAVTFVIAELVPHLSLFISLIGALCSTAIALVFPPVIELITYSDYSKGPGIAVFVKNIFILLLALLGFTTGTYESIHEIVKAYQ